MVHLSENPPPDKKNPEIGFENLGDVPLSEKGDVETDRIKEKAIRDLQVQQIKKQVTEQAGGGEKKKVTPIPKDLPRLVFRYGAKAISCEKFNTTNEENEILAKHLTNILGTMDSKIFSVVIILIIVIGKVVDCKDRVMSMFNKKKEKIDDSETPEGLPEQLK